MKYHTLFFSKIKKGLVSQNLASAAVVFGALGVNVRCNCLFLSDLVPYNILMNICCFSENMRKKEPTTE